LWVWVQAVFSLIGLGFIMKAYLIGEVTYVSIFEYSMLIFATLTAWFIFGDEVGVLGVLGIGLIIVTGTVVLIRSKER
jgi:drug/metabolite transporter (DMT)-like permease